MRNRTISLLSWVFCALIAAGLAAPRALAQTTGGTTGTTGGTTTGNSGSILSSGGAGFNAGGSGTSGAGATGSSGSTVTGSYATSGSAISTRTGAFNTNNTGSTNSTSITNPTSPSASTTGIPSTTNPFRTAYGNPYIVGAPLSSNTSFGQPMYGKATTTNTNTTKSTTTSNSGQGFSALGANRVPSYSTVLTDDFPLVSHPSSEILGKVEAALSNSSFLKQREAIIVNVKDRVVFLSGQVGTEKERRIAEGMVRLTPGVLDVRNDIQVLGATANSQNNP